MTEPNKELPKEVQHYTKKSSTILAVIWTGENTDTVLSFCEGNATLELMASGNTAVVINTLESDRSLQTRHAASIGDYIIRGVAGEFYPCKPDIFIRTYTEGTDPKDKIISELKAEVKKVMWLLKEHRAMYHEGRPQHYIEQRWRIFCKENGIDLGGE